MKGEKIRILIAGFFVLSLVICVIYINNWYKKNTSIYKTDQYLKSIVGNQRLVDEFFKKMPKGADLHMHIGGSEYAENFIHYGIVGHFCIDENNEKVFEGENCNNISNADLYNKLIQAWSMKDFKASKKESASTHFFSSFNTDPILSRFYGNVLGDIVANSANNNVFYIELQTTEDDDKIDALVTGIR